MPSNNELKEEIFQATKHIYGNRENANKKYLENIEYIFENEELTSVSSLRRRLMFSSYNYQEMHEMLMKTTRGEEVSPLSICNVAYRTQIKVENLQREKSDLERERNEWKRKFNDKNRECEDYKEKSERIQRELDNLKNERIRDTQTNANEKSRLERENAALRVENTRKDEQLTSANNQVIDLSRRLENKEEEVGIVRREKEEQAIMFENKLDQKSTLLENVRQSLRDLEIRNEREKSEKDSEVREKDSELRTKEEELKRKGEEVKRAQRKANQSQEELLTEKIRIKYEKLEIFANRIEINLQQVNDLCRYCERLIRARKSGNQVNIETHEDNIARVREGLRQRGLQIENIQKFCNKCEKIAKLRVELSEIRQQQGQQYEARQETPPLNNNNRIN
ncbi:MAG: hypothetical protein MRERV_52c015 [Mycoplasmataceae bacterium RV_VA103A]|nr:MAG: hypothetical protein MRERV_52c015 [Mycoplasmataceae bacterium RV_VA103A]